MIGLRNKDQLVADARALLRRRKPGMSTSRDTLPGAIIEMVSDALIGLQSQLRSGEQNIFPHLGDEDALEEHAEAHLGPNPRRPATIASGINALQISGTVGVAVSTGDALVHVDGTQFRVTRRAVIGSDGHAFVDIESISKGSTSRKGTGEVLSFEAPAAGIAVEAVLVANLTGGYDAESNGELLTRVLHAIQYPPAGGRWSDYLSWSMAVPGVGHAYIYMPSDAAPTGRRGMGVVDVAILLNGTGAARVPDAILQQQVLDALAAARPGTDRDSAVLLPAAVSQAWDVRLTPSVGYEWDWTSAAAWTVATYEPAHSGGPRITWNAALPVGVEAGKRLLCNGEVALIASVGSNYTILVDPLASSPTTGEAIYPAGPLSTPALTAIKGLMDELGPARGAAAVPDQAWECTIKHSKAYRAIMDISGVEDANIITPAASVTPVDHVPSGTVDLLVYGKITVRPA